MEIINENKNTGTKPKISVRDLNLYYGSNHALKSVNMDIKPNAVTAFIGPSGCGKSTFLKTLNRMNDLVENCKIDGEVFQLIIPLPLNGFFDMFEPVLQGYIFVMLTMVFTANGRKVEE